jgi:hypothetical protein
MEFATQPEVSFPDHDVDANQQRVVGVEHRVALVEH